MDAQPPRALRRIVIAELNKRKARDKSITLAALFDDYVAKLEKTGRSDGYLKQYRWCKSYLEFWRDTKVSDITPDNIKFSFSNLPPKISPSGKRERRFFTHHHEALAEANRIRDVFPDYGRSIRMLPANRLIESIECWDLLDQAVRVTSTPIYGSCEQC